MTLPVNAQPFGGTDGRACHRRSQPPPAPVHHASRTLPAPRGGGRCVRPTVDHAVQGRIGSGGEHAEASERLEPRRIAGFSPSGTPAAAEAAPTGPGAALRSPSTSSSVRLVHPGLAAGVDVAVAAAAELVAGPRTGVSKRCGTGAGRHRPRRRAGQSSRPRGSGSPGPDEDVQSAGPPGGLAGPRQCRKPSFATLADRLRPRLEANNPDAGEAARLESDRLHFTVAGIL